MYRDIKDSVEWGKAKYDAYAVKNVFDPGYENTWDFGSGFKLHRKVDDNGHIEEVWTYPSDYEIFRTRTTARNAEDIAITIQDYKDGSYDKIYHYLVAPFLEIKRVHFPAVSIPTKGVPGYTPPPVPKCRSDDIISKYTEWRRRFIFDYGGEDEIPFFPPCSLKERSELLFTVHDLLLKLYGEGNLFRKNFDEQCCKLKVIS